jgi:hypothetical protein
VSERCNSNPPEHGPEVQHIDGDACPRLGDQCCPEHAEEWDRAGEHNDGYPIQSGNEEV